MPRKHWYKSGVDLGCGPPRRIPGPTSCWGPLEDIVPCPHTEFEPDPTRGQSTGLSTRFVSEWCEGGSRRTRAASGALGSRAPAGDSRRRLSLVETRVARRDPSADQTTPVTGGLTTPAQRPWSRGEIP